MGSVKVGGQEIHFEQSEGEPGRALILLHGSGGSSKNWPESVKQLPGVNVYAVDLPGHGKSSGEPPQSVAAYADWVEELVDELGLARVALCGHSLGGAIALTLALRKPSWLSSMVLVGTGARLRVHPAILAGVKHATANVSEMMLHVVFGPDTDGDARAALAESLPDAAPEVLLNDFQACDAFDVMDQVEEISVPTLVIGASHDQLTPLKYAQYLAEAIPNAEQLVIEGAGHLVALEKPDELAAAVTRFLGVAG